MKNILHSHKTYIVLLAILILAITGSLRFINLGYSEYIPDETTVMWPIKHKEAYDTQYLLSQKKGPMQYVTAFLVSLVNADVYNEFAFRLPFCIFSCLSILLIFFSVKKLSGSYWVSTVASLLFGLNGFTVAFGRIVQYQSLNIFFSVLAVFFYSFLLDRKIGYVKQKIFSMTGTLCLFLSLLAHWDMIFILPLVIYIWFRYIKFGRTTIETKKDIINLNAGIVILLVIPFITLYMNAFLSSEAQREYFSSRIGGSFFSIEQITDKFNEYSFRFFLYNPFFYLPIVSALLLLSFFEWKKAKVYWIWTLLIAIPFLLFVKKPGTHIYNIFLPVSILCGYGFNSFTKYFKKNWAIVPSILLIPVIVVLWRQNYLLFVDPTIEYPWQQETVYGYSTAKYNHENLTNNIIGFPKRRNWVEINNFVNNTILTSGIALPYISNEVKSISGFYMDIPFEYADEMYGIGVKKPFSFENDYGFPQYHNKNTLGKVDYKGDTTAKIYLINNSKSD